MRFDVILHPRDWVLKRYARGIIVGLTGKYDNDGSVMIQKFRVGQPIG